ncbi:MAG: hypothetical protein KJ044_07730 [Planctomycetes bacterium]|nr:hypothetical protein [Planctomycetota bacterium]
MDAKLCLVFALVAVLAAGCTGPQSRKARQDHGVSEDLLRQERARHGNAGAEIALLFNTGKIRDARADTSGRTQGLQGTEFFMVQIAPHPRQPTQLVKVGFARRVEEDRGKLYYYEFYDGAWNTIGLLMPGGELYRHVSGREELLGRYDLNGAVVRLYPAPSGYGYDQVAQDFAPSNMKDPEVAGGDSRSRGVFHTPHGTYPPVVVFTAYRAGEARKLADNWERTRHEESEALKLERLRERRHGGIGQDESYGGLDYKKGDPVDGDGKPLRPGGAPGK